MEPERWWLDGSIATAGMILTTLSCVYLFRRRPLDVVVMWGWVPWRGRLVGAEILRIAGFFALILGALQFNSGLGTPWLGIAVILVGALPSLVVSWIHNARVRRRARQNPAAAVSEE